MRHLLKSLGLLTVIITASVAAQTPAHQVAPHPADEAVTTLSPQVQMPCSCPMMTGKGAGKPASGISLSAKEHGDKGKGHCSGMPRPEQDAGDGR